MSVHSQIRKMLGKDALEVSSPRKERLFIRIAREKLRKTIKKLIQLEGHSHLSTITGVDTGTEIDLIYHLSHRDALISMSVRTPKEDLTVPTIVDLVPGATLYEREIHDLLGVIFKGNPDLPPLLLPDLWPDNIHPLRKEWTPERISEKMRGK